MVLMIFWVVANPTEANDAYKSCQSLDALKEIIEGGDSLSSCICRMKANQLVKVGNKSATFDVTTVALQSDPVNTVGCTGGTGKCGWIFRDN